MSVPENPVPSHESQRWDSWLNASYPPVDCPHTDDGFHPACYACSPAIL